MFSLRCGLSDRLKRERFYHQITLLNPEDFVRGVSVILYTYTSPVMYKFYVIIIDIDINWGILKYTLILPDLELEPRTFECSVSYTYKHFLLSFIK